MKVGQNQLMFGAILEILLLFFFQLYQANKVF